MDSNDYISLDDGDIKVYLADFDKDDHVGVAMFNRIKELEVDLFDAELHKCNHSFQEDKW